MSLEENIEKFKNNKNTKKSNHEKKKSKSVKRYFDTSIEDEDAITDQKLNNKDGKQKRFDQNEKIIQVSMKEKPFRQFNRYKRNLKIKKPKISKELLEKYSRGEGAEETGVKTKYFKEKIKRKEKLFEYAIEQAARTEILLNEEKGFIVVDEDERTEDFRQKDLIKHVDITAASKHFKLSLDFGPYKLRYTKNGRHLLLGGRMGHVAAFDWVTKKLHCEMNVMEELSDIAWLHIETMFACAQKNWVHFYDNKGTEIHCVKKLYSVNKLEFLPYHFLLAAASSEGYLSWLDVSIGEFVGHYKSKLGDIRIMRQNPSNGVLCIGSGNGVVSMWSPKIREPLAKMLCHSTPMTSLAVDPKGLNLATSGLDRKIKIWDIRQLSGPMAEYNLFTAAREIDISQKGCLAFSVGSVCEIYSQTILNDNDKTESYLRYRADDYIHGLRFCPYEDVLGIGTGKGFTSILVPGSGEPNYDALEANPFQTKSQRRENEVHALLEKIPAEFITLDPNEIAGVDVETLQDRIESKKNILFVKPPEIDIKTRRKMKGKGGSVNAARNKKIVKETMRKEFFKEIQKQKKDIIETYKKTDQEENNQDFIPLESTSTSVLDIFKPKKKKIKF